jgi:hypothetical protein
MDATNAVLALALTNDRPVGVARSIHPSHEQLVG